MNIVQHHQKFEKENSEAKWQPVRKVVVLDLSANVDLLNCTDQCILVHNLHHRSHLDVVLVTLHHLTWQKTRDNDLSKWYTKLELVCGFV